MLRTIIATAAITLVSAGPALSKTCTGTFRGGVATSIKFIGGKQIRYCYNTSCGNHVFSGDQDSRMKLIFGGGRAELNLIASGSNYRGTYRRRGGRPATVTYKCK